MNWKKLGESILEDKRRSEHQLYEQYAAAAG